MVDDNNIVNSLKGEIFGFPLFGVALCLFMPRGIKVLKWHEIFYCISNDFHAKILKSIQ